jgi:hypothetical protein
MKNAINITAKDIKDIKKSLINHREMLANLEKIIFGEVIEKHNDYCRGSLVLVTRKETPSFFDKAVKGFKHFMLTVII